MTLSTSPFIESHIAPLKTSPEVHKSLEASFGEVRGILLEAYKRNPVRAELLLMMAAEDICQGANFADGRGAFFKLVRECNVKEDTFSLQINLANLQKQGDEFFYAALSHIQREAYEFAIEAAADAAKEENCFAPFPIRSVESVEDLDFY